MNVVFFFVLVLTPFACRSVPAAPAPQQVAQVHSHSASASGSGDGYVQLTVNGDHGDLLLVMHGDQFTGILDGEVLPAERLVRKGDKLSVNGADGSALYEIMVDTDSHSLFFPYGSPHRMASGVYDLRGADAAAWRGYSVMSESRKLIGVNTSEVSEALRAQLGLEGDAFLIESVNADMPAARAGMQPFDVVTAIEGSTGATTEHLREVLDAKKAGDSLGLTVLRHGRSQDLTLTVEDAKPSGVYSMSTAADWPGTTVWSTNDDAKAVQELLAKRETLQTSRAELAERMAALQADTEKLSSEQSGEVARQLADVARRQAEIAEQIRAAAEAHQDASGSYLGLLQSGDNGSRYFMLPTSPGGRATVLGPGGAAAAMSDDRLAQLEARLAKLEALLERLAPPADASRSGEDKGSKP